MPAHIDAAVAYDLNAIGQCHWCADGGEWTWNSKESCNSDFDTKHHNETVFKSKAWKEFTNGAIVIFCRQALIWSWFPLWLVFK